MPIAFRLSIVAALVGAILSVGNYYLRQHRLAEAVMINSIRIDLALECAHRHSDEELKPHANIYGLIDISKVYCADKLFLATTEEIRNARTQEERIAKAGAVYWEEFSRYTSWHSWFEFGLPGAAAGFIAVNVLGLLMVGLRRVLSWAVGARRHAGRL
jgi:hypothetical protein